MRQQLLCGVLGLGTLACGAGWHQPGQVTPGTWPPRQQVQVWVGGQAMRWHAVVVGADSITGVPFVRPPDCDACREAIPRDGVDSVRVGQPVQGFWKTAVLFVGVPLFLLVVVCGREGSACMPET